MNATRSALDGIQHVLGLPWSISIFAIIHIIVVVFVALAVKKDAERRSLAEEELFLASPWLWFFVVLITGGYLATLAYWLMHYSFFRHRREENG